MPKVKGFRNPDRWQRVGINIEKALVEAEKSSGMTRADICKKLDISKTTLWARLRKPDKFTLGELRAIATLANKSYPELLSEIVK